MIRSGQVEFYDALEALFVPIDSITPHPENYNNGDVEKIMESILANGMFDVLKVQESTGYIAAGNHTWEACKQLGAQVIPAVFNAMDDMTTKRVMIAHNWIAGLARPDSGALLSLVDQIADAEGSIAGIGMEERDRENLRLLADIPLEHDEFGSWPTLSITMPPHTRARFYDMTEAAAGDLERFELLLRMAQ